LKLCSCGFIHVRTLKVFCLCKQCNPSHLWKSLEEVVGGILMFWDVCPG
jgi:hypothetical protein